MRPPWRLEWGSVHRLDHCAGLQVRVSFPLLVLFEPGIPRHRARQNGLEHKEKSCQHAQMTSAFIPGFALSFSLILAIGAQNAFVLRQGLRRSHVLAVCLTCAVSDALLITLGVAGFSWIAEAAPWIQPLFRWGGAVFLLVYGALAFRNAIRGGETLEAAGQSGQSLRAAILTCLALTWLNPHVYLDTLVLIGSVSTEYPGQSLAFGAGAVTASFVFFFSLGYGARALAPFFARPVAWRILDVIVGSVMWAIAAGLILA